MRRTECWPRFEGRFGNPILGIVQIDARSFSRHSLATLRLVCEKLPQVQRDKSLQQALLRHPNLPSSLKRG